MLRKAPSLEAIEIFVAASKGDSFRSVARQLALSPSAISRRIAGLESFLGLALFHRNGQSQRLTAAGRRYLSLVEPAIDAIQRASVTIEHGDQVQLRVATSHSFAAAWLMPRLADLYRRCSLEVEIIPTRDCNVLRSGAAQLGIWGGLAVPQDMVAETLVEAQAVPVASPNLGEHACPRPSDGDEAAFPLLSVRDPAGLWDRWFATFGRGRWVKPVVREYATLQLMYEAAASGAGVALAVPLVAEPWLKAGKLVPCSGNSLALGETYRLYRPTHRIARTDVEQRFTDWLHGEVGASMTTFAALTGGKEDKLPESPLLACSHRRGSPLFLNRSAQI